MAVVATTADPEGDDVEVTWSSSCEDTRFVPDAHALAPFVEIDPACDTTCILTVIARDQHCGAAGARVVLEVRDDVPPTLSGVPRDLAANCEDVVMRSSVTATDRCDPAPVVTIDVRRTVGRCPAEFHLERTWTATDACGNVASATQVVDSLELVPPVLTPDLSVVRTIWPPNGRRVTVRSHSFTPVFEDACSSATFRLESCVIEEDLVARRVPLDPSDCVVAADGASVVVKARRSGGSTSGRRYVLIGVAEDACGNVSEPVPVGMVVVPHDQRDRRR